MTGRFRYYYLFNGRTRIPGEFKFTNVHLAKVWAIRSASTPSEELGSSEEVAELAEPNDADDEA